MSFTLNYFKSSLVSHASPDFSYITYMYLSNASHLFGGTRDRVGR